MPVTPTYPGVYIEEVPSPVRTITGVATSIAAFVDFFRRGPMNTAVQLFGVGDFEREFGGLDARSEASYAIRQFFLNGGSEAWAVRVASAAGTNVPTAANVIALDGVGGGAATALTIRALSEGAWGDDLRVAVDYRTSDPATRFNLTVTEVATVSGRTVVSRQETFRNLSMTATDPAFVEAVVNGTSTLVTVDAAGANMPAASGTVSGAGVGAVAPGGADPMRVRATLTYNDGGSPANEVRDLNLGTTAIAGVDEAAARLEAALRNANPGNPAWAQATVRAVGDRLQVTAGPARPATTIDFANAPADAALGFAADNATSGALRIRSGMAGVVSNVAQYQVGSTIGNGGAVGAQGAGVQGLDGVPPDATALIGSAATDPPTGMFALDKVDLFNILSLPRIARVSGTTTNFASAQVNTVVSAAVNYCDTRRAFLVLDTPSDVVNPLQLKQWLASTLDALRDRNAAVYFPRVLVADPEQDFRPRSFGASGTVAGLYARIDATRGVWKAPAGTEASLRGIQGLEYKLSDQENGVVNPLGINALRRFDVYGNVAWGARTLEGADQQASEWKYVPVRRLALYIEESLFRGTKWVVFEPNDAPLWSQIRLNVGAFMHDLFRKGAFQGVTPREAYLVKCDAETTTQTDIDHGIVNIVVGFAPLKPAEFVIIRIQQLAGQIET